MQITDPASPTRRRLEPLALLLAAVGIEFVHCMAPLFSHASLYSNAMQLLSALLALAVCARRFRQESLPASRLRWLALSSAFCIWVLAQGEYILLKHRLFWPDLGRTLDDALWILLGLPLLLTSYCNDQEETDWVRLLDRAQASLFFLALYILVFLPSIRMSFERAFNVQDVALVICGLLRLATSSSTRERRFYARFNIFLAAYAACMWTGHIAYAHGAQEGALIDVVWTLPLNLFSVLTLVDELRPPQEEVLNRLQLAAQAFQGIGIAILAFASIGVSALVMHYTPIPGLALLVCAFTLFAIRMTLRERAVQIAHSELQTAVLHDHLTGLGNRLLLRNILAKHLAAATNIGQHLLLLLDLDCFKAVNDSMGDAFGDQLLIEVGQRLRRVCPPGSTICRAGGDNFAVFTTIEPNVSPLSVGESILRAVRHPYENGSHMMRLTTSIGMVSLREGNSIEDLFRMADHATCRAKALGKNRVQMFDAALLSSLTQRWQMENDLRKAIEQKKVSLAYQPIVDLASGLIVGVEALARWFDPVWGQVSPADFIPLAEETGLVVQLGMQLLEDSCTQVAAWNQMQDLPLRLNVNVSPRQLADPDFLNCVLQMLERTGLEPSSLCLEITESAVLVDESAAREVLQGFRDHSITIALDDFGTGYSSLSFLMKLPVDEVKIDRSFISGIQTDPQRRELAQSLVQMAHSFGRKVVAEGVEEEGDRMRLAQMGCEYIQGWLVSQPLSAEAFIQARPVMTARLQDKFGCSHTYDWSERLLPSPREVVAA